MSIAPYPWKLCSNEQEQNFQITGADGLPVAVMHTQNSALVAPWRNKKLSPKDIWLQISNEREQANARLITAAPKLFDLCELALRCLQEDDFPSLRQDLRETIAYINQEST